MNLSETFWAANLDFKKVLQTSSYVEKQKEWYWLERMRTSHKGRLRAVNIKYKKRRKGNVWKNHMMKH